MYMGSGAIWPKIVGKDKGRIVEMP